MACMGPGGGRVRAHAPGRVNLIGDHTDYTGGYVLPMAIDMGTTVEIERGGDRIELSSSGQPEPACVDLDVDQAGTVSPDWARYVAGVVAVLRPAVGARGSVSTSLPVGAGLSSSAALEVALALALGFEGGVAELAVLCQQAEQLASGVPSGVMDQLASAAGVAGHALLIDCTSLQITPMPVPDGVDVVVVDSGERRALATSAYAERRAQCEAAIEVLGPLREASPADVATLPDGVVRRRARHVVTENERVVQFSQCLRRCDMAGAGRLMVRSHASLRDDFEVSTPALDRLVGELTAIPGVFGARLTGAGFGGCAVALAEAGTPVPGWRVRAVNGATVEAS